MQMSLFPMSGLEDSPAKMSRLRGWLRDQGLRGSNLGSFMNLLDSLKKVAPEFLSSRTFQVSVQAMEGGTSKSLFKHWPNSGMAWDGVFLTADTLESPNHASESTLSDVIETGKVPQRYFLSPNAAAGMIRRTDQMGRKLFPPLRRSLEILAKGR